MSIPAQVSCWRQHIKDTVSAQPCDPDLLLALVWQESLGRPWATRSEPAFWGAYLAGKPEWSRGLTGDVLACWRDRVSRSYGLMQIMPATAAWMGLAVDSDPEVLFRPTTNLYYGAKFVRHLMKTHGDERSLALGYNGGARLAYADELLAKLAAVKGT